MIFIHYQEFNLFTYKKVCYYHNLYLVNWYLGTYTLIIHKQTKFTLIKLF